METAILKVFLSYIPTPKYSIFSLTNFVVTNILVLKNMAFPGVFIKDNKVTKIMHGTNRHTTRPLSLAVAFYDSPYLSRPWAYCLFISVMLASD